MYLFEVRKGLEMAMIPLPIAEVIRSLLKDLEQRIAFKNREELYQDLARRLSAVAGRKEVWSSTYVINALNPKFESRVGKPFVRAANILAATLDGLPLQIAQAKSVTVFALGSVKENSLITGNSIPCKNPTCTVWFVPNVWNRRECYVCKPVKRRAED